MTRPRANTSDLTTSGGSPRLGIFLSVAFHALVIAGLMLFSFQNPISSDIIAAGEGEGGEGGGGAIEVGLTDASSILGFAKPQEVSFPGDTDDPLNNTRLESIPREDEAPDEVLPKTERETDPTAEKTNRPITNQQERIFTSKDERGRSDSDSIQQGRSYGSPSPSDFRQGVALGPGSGLGAGTGVPGGSTWGRLIQTRLMGNYSTKQYENVGQHYVIVKVEFARNGAILSFNFAQPSPSFLVGKDVERAIRASNPLPEAPLDFKPGVQRFSAELWFRYPK